MLRVGKESRTDVRRLRQARELVHETQGIEETRALAEDYAEKAIAALKDFPASEAKDGLVEMAVKAIKRRK